ncbi:MAG: hypothetical protein GQ529_03030 [Methyloprofundus sp.]|nr:hypothetical protein [Methyloprofundus sp.]
MLFKFLSYLMVLFFLMSVGVQYNDPDWLMWIFLYGAILLTTLINIFNRSHKVRWILYPLLIVYGLGVFQLSDSFQHTSLDAFMAVGMKNVMQEEVRELWGLVICFVWASVVAINSFKYEKE